MSAAVDGQPSGLSSDGMPPGPPPDGEPPGPPPEGIYIFYVQNFLPSN